MSTALRIAHGSFGRVALLDMDASLVRHAHPHCHVLLKVEGADTQFLVGDTVVPLTDTSAVMVDGWQSHAYVHDPARPRTLILALYVEPQWLKAFRPAWAASGAPGFFAQPCGEISPRIRQLARDLAADMMARPDGSGEHEVLLSDLMIAVIERFTPWRSFPASLRAMNTSRADWRIRRVAEAIRTDVSRNVDVAVLAREAGLSRAHFFRLFESSIGVPPRVYLNVMRLERAVDAVVNDNANVAEIGTRLGFDVPAHFTRFFRNHTGVSPREFRAVSRLAH
ncbi:MAG: transcriptional regulator, AraC family [Tardiphaga sp.]|jgi:AraC-like DNA-binding protein|nr:transcriptional regulator, AraC family [Tardiphaga sp.]